MDRLLLVTTYRRTSAERATPWRVDDHVSIVYGKTRQRSIVCAMVMPLRSSHGVNLLCSLTQSKTRSKNEESLKRLAGSRSNGLEKLAYPEVGTVLGVTRSPDQAVRSRHLSIYQPLQWSIGISKPQECTTRRKMLYVAHAALFRSAIRVFSTRVYVAFLVAVVSAFIEIVN